MSLRNKRPNNVVAAVEEQTAQAAELASIAGQDRLANPLTNPATRAHADRLRNVQHRTALDAEHGRRIRGHRVAGRRAEHAERALEAIQQAREASSAARSVLALHTGRTRFTRATLAASIALSAGAASGVAALAVKNDAPELAGWVAEVGFTGLTTTVILYRSHLAQHGGKVDGWQDKVLWLLMIAPLMASMAANLFGAGPVGIACSVGAAAFSLLSYVVADASAAAIHQQATRVTGEDEVGLHSIAIGDDLFTTPPSAEPNQEARVAAEPVNPEVREPVRNLRTICSRNVNLLEVRVEANQRTANREPVREPESVNPEPRTGEPANPEVHEPAPNHEPANPQTTNHEPKTTNQTARTETANLGDRATKKRREIEKVLNLIEKRGSDAVTLDVVLKELGFKKTTAYHRLTAARELFANQAAEAS